MMNVLKWTLAVVTAVVFLITATLAGGHLYFTTDRGARRLLGVINTLYPGEITGSALQVSLLRQEVTVRDAMLRGPDGRQVLSSERVFLKMDLPALLGMDLVFEVIDAARPDFVLELDKDGWLNIEAAFVEKTPGEGPINVYINRLTCTDGTFVYRGGDGKPVVRLDNLDLSFDSAFEHDALMHFSSPKTSIALFVSGKRIDLGTGSASCTIFNDQVRDIRAAVAKGATRASLTGSITRMAEKAQFDLDLALDGELADLREALGLGPETAGRIRGHVTARRDYDNPDFTCALTYGGGTLGGLRIGRTSVEGVVTDRVASIRDLAGEYASGRVSITGTVDLRQLFPEGYFEGIKEEESLAYDLAITGTSLLLDDIPGMPKGFTGRISPRIALKGSGTTRDSLRIDTAFSARGSGVSAGGILRQEDLDLDGRLSFRKDILDVGRLNVRTRVASAAASGRVDLASHGVDGILTLNAPGAAPLLARAGVRGSGSLNASLRIRGTWDAPAADITARAGNVVVEDVTLGSIDLRALLDEGGRLNIQSFTLANKGSTITAGGSLQVFRRFPDMETDPDTNLDMNLKAVNPADFSGEIPLSVSMDGRITAAGRLSSLTADMDLKGNDLSTGGIRLGSATMKGALSRGMLTVTGLELTNGHSVLLMSGDAQVFDPQQKRFIKDPAVHLTVRGHDLLFEDFTEMAKGAFSLDADLEGTLRRPAGVARLSAGEIDLGFQRLKSLDIQARADGDMIWIEPAVLTIAEGENINAHGMITMGGAYEFSLGTPGISLGSLDLARNFESARGMVFLHATGQGLLSNPALTGRISAADIVFLDTPLDDMTFSFDLKDHVLAVDGRWNFRLNARHDLSTGTIEAEALFAETELAPFFTLAGRRSLSGRLTGRMEARGKLSALKEMDITADISSLDILHDSQDIVMARNAAASYRHGLLTIPRTRLTLAKNGWFDVQGQGEVKKSLTLDADGIVPLEVLGLFSEDLADSSGLIRVSSQLRTRGLRSELSAQLTLDDLAWTIPVNGQRLHSVNGRIDLKDGILAIEGITGRLDDGSFQLGGTASFKGTTPRHMELLAQAKALPVTIPDMMDLVVDAEASLDMNGTASRLWADAVILDGVYYKDVKANIFFGVIERILPMQQRVKAKKEAISMPWPFMESMVLDVSIKRRGEVKVENNIADLDINPDLKITGTLSKPVVNGRVAVTDGVVTFQNNDFAVSKGVIDFLDPSRTRAQVDISGTTQVRDWKITLTLEGELDNLQINLSSMPAEDPGDILSLLIVGKTSRELTKDQSSVGVSTSGMLAELVTSTYGSDIKKATTLDILEISASEFSTSEGGESLKLTVGKELSRKMTVKYEMETRNTETVQKAIAEYKILENLLINGYQSSDGIFGTDMLYRHEFR
ncbi:MAG: translocation/assembly module TamB [Desulfobacterota bacterium]|nr:translocation/assembly module TamB [Thermodesulfobacteriota bacterium]